MMQMYTLHNPRVYPNCAQSDFPYHDHLYLMSSLPSSNLVVLMKSGSLLHAIAWDLWYCMVYFMYIAIVCCAIIYVLVWMNTNWVSRKMWLNWNCLIQPPGPLDIIDSKPIIKWDHNYVYKTIGKHIVKAIELRTTLRSLWLAMKSPYSHQE